MKFAYFHIPLCIACSVLSAGNAQANLLTNGSFESPVLSSPFTRTYAADSTAIVGWTVVGGPVEHNAEGYAYFDASDGKQLVDLTGIYGYNKGLISDAVSTVVGASYILSFDLGSIFAWGSTTVSVQINDETPVLFVNVKNGTGYTTDWETESLTWVADDLTAQITFLGVANSALSNDGVIPLDNVVFKAVGNPIPEPATYTMILAGLGLMGQ